MPFNGSGTFTRAMNWTADATAGVKIKADRHDTEDDGFASGLTNCVTKDGQTQPSANLPMNGKKLINLGAPTNPLDATTKQYVDGLRQFSSPIEITGSTPDSRLKFTGTTGPWGDSYVTADMAYGVRGTQWVWNDKADFSGNDVMLLSKVGILTLQNIDAGASAAPILSMHRKSASPAASDLLGLLGFSGMNSAAAVATYGQIYVQINDPTSGSEDSTMAFSNITAGAGTTRLTLHLSGASITGDAYVSGHVTASGGWFIGSGGGAILATPAGSGATVYLRPNGPASAAGEATVTSAGHLTVSASVFASGGINSTSSMTTSAAGNFVSGASGYKPGGGPWGDSSDSRIKDVTGDYTAGLDAILALRPVRFTFKGNDTIEAPNGGVEMGEDGPITLEAPEIAPYPNSIHMGPATTAKEFIGLIAQEAEIPMPEMVTLREGYIDGEPVDDLRDLDTGPLAFAFINAFKEIDARLKVLEGAPA